MSQVEDFQGLGRPNELQPVLELLRRECGLVFSEHNQRHVEIAVREGLNRTGQSDPTRYAAFLEDPEAGHLELEKLVCGVTIGETYFFRHPEQFIALRERVLPELIGRRRRSGAAPHLRVWSAGCSTGEEPYTISMVLRESLPLDWTYSVLATDISRQAIESARRAHYGEWSFRGVEDRVREAYFRPVADKQLELLPEIREPVRFSELNLCRDIFPSILTDTHQIDLLFCRNVLIYFEAGLTRLLIDRFRAALADGSWLFVSPAEAGGAMFASLDMVELPQATAFRAVGLGDRGTAEPPSLSRHRRSKPGPSVPRPAPLVPDHRQARRELRKRLEGLSTGGVAEAAPEPVPPADDASYLRARQAADRGEFQDAVKLAQAAGDEQPLSTRVWHLLGLIHQELGDLAAATEAYRRAVYLDSEFALGHFGLAVVARRSGQASEAERLLRNVRRLVGELEDDELLPGAEEVSVGWLRSMLEHERKAIHAGA